MSLRFWIGLAAVIVIGAGAVAAALIVRADDKADFDRAQRETAARAAHQTEAVAEFSVDQLATATAFIQAEGDLNEHEFDVIGNALLEQGLLTGNAFLPQVDAGERAGYERRHGFPITERDGQVRLVPAAPQPTYYPITYVAAPIDTNRALGYDLGADPDRSRYLTRAANSGEAVATPLIHLLLGGSGVNVYHAVYRDGAPTATPAQRREALIGFVVGTFMVSDIIDSALSALPGNAEMQLRTDDGTVLGADDLDDAAAARIQIADRTWLLVVRDPNRPSIALPVLLAGVGISLAALLGALILVWSRNERMQELQREASHDSLTGLKNRRRFEEELRAAMARAKRDRTTGAMLMLDIDHFKRVNDTHGHPAGDRLIEEIAAVLRRRTRASDVLARLGGDEFAVALPRCSRQEAVLTAESIARSIREHEPEGEIEPVTASIGVAMFGEDPRVGYALIVSEADTAMYAAKDGGRDGVRVFDPVAVSEDQPAG